MTAKRCWRITLTNSALEQQVEHLARREGRSLSNMLHRLLVEALDRRREHDRQKQRPQSAMAD